MFIKTKKSAGTSVEISLSRYCDGPEDVITEQNRKDQVVQSAAGVRPKNYRNPNQTTMFSEHMPAPAIRRLIGEEMWNAYTKICIVRNPWSRAVSQYFFRMFNFGNPPQSFEHFIRTGSFTNELYCYSENHRILVNDVIRFENLEKDLLRVTEKINLNWDGWLPKAKSQFSIANKHYSEFYDQQTADIVATKCADEIKAHQHKFEWKRAVKAIRSDRENVLHGNVSVPVRISQHCSTTDELNTCNNQPCEDNRIAKSQLSKELWALCDGKNTAAEMFNTLSKKAELPSGTLSTDILILLDKWQRSKLIDAKDLITSSNQQYKEIDLRDFVFYIINCREDFFRKARMASQLQTLGLNYRFVPGIKVPGRKKVGVAVSHINTLLERTDGRPFVVLEDDCVFTENFQYQFRIPQDTDALYLGVSLFGCKMPGLLSEDQIPEVRCIPYVDDYIRVFNMLGSHAIVYLSDKYRLCVANSVKQGLSEYGDRFPIEAYYAKLQVSHLVLTPRARQCYQQKSPSGNEHATAKSLSEFID